MRRSNNKEMTLRWIAYLFLCLMMTQKLRAEDPIHIPDRNLKAVIEEELGVFDPTASDMRGLTSMDGNSENIKDLTGLEYATNLRSFRITHNHINDLSPLANLTNLRTLIPNNNQISDLSPLANLTQLEHLDIHENDISDMSVLDNLTQLEYLNIHENHIDDITPLAALENLTFLNIADNDISDISPLSTLSTLQTLILSDNHISDISCLHDLTALESLWLDDNTISDLSVLAELENINYVNASRNAISTLPYSLSSSSISELYLTNNSIHDLTPLIDLANLSYLDVSENTYLSNAAYSDNLHMLMSSQIALHYSPNPNTPRIAHVSQGVYPNRIHITWHPHPNGPSYTSFYRVYKSTSLTGEREAITSWHQGNSVDDVQVDLGVRYYYWIRVAVDELGSEAGDYSQPAGGYAVGLQDITLYVDDDASGDPTSNGANTSDLHENGTQDHPFDSIQEAVVAASPGSTVLVLPGVYHENIDLLGKNIILSGMSTGNAGHPIIQGSGNDPLVRFTHHEDVNCVLQGFVLTGHDLSASSVLHCQGSRPTILNCLIVGNYSSDPLSPSITVLCEESQTAIINCTFTDNVIPNSGTCIWMRNSDVLLTNSILWNNTSTEIRIETDNTPIISHNTIGGQWHYFFIDMGNSKEAPLFVNSGRWVNTHQSSQQWIMGDYHLTSQEGHWNQQTLLWVADEVSSPCLDQGDPGYLLFNEPIPHGSVINMGAYGGTTEASLSLKQP